MNASDIAIVVLLASALAVEWLCSLGMLAMRTPYDRLHAIGPANILPPAFVAAAVLVDSGFSSSAIKASLIALALILSSPVLTHAIARTAYLRERDRPPVHK